MPLIYDNDAVFNIKLDSFPDLLANQVVVWHEYDVSPLHVTLLVVVGAHLLAFIEGTHVFNRQRILN